MTVSQIGPFVSAPRVENLRSAVGDLELTLEGALRPSFLRRSSASGSEHLARFSIRVNLAV